MKFFIFFLVFTFLGQILFAQKEDFNISGKVIDKETQKPIEMVNVRFESGSMGTVSNREGGFSIYQSPRNSAQTLLFSYVGYKTFVLKISDLAKKDNLLIPLEPDATFLNEIVITDKRTPPIMTILANIVRNMPKNYPTEPYTYEAFYREYMMDSDTCRRLVEAAVEVHDHKGYSLRRTNSQTMFMKIKHLRSSYDFSKFKNSHGVVEKNFPEEHNWLRMQRMIFDEDRQKVIKFRLVQQTILDNEVLYEVNFSGEEISMFRKLRGTLWVNASNFAVERLKFHYTPDFEAVGSIDRESDYNFQVFYEVEENLVFKPQNGKYFLAYQNKRSTEHYQDDLTQYDESQSETFTEMLTTHVQTENVVPFADSSAEEIRKLRYDHDFWKTFTTPADTPQDQKRKADLEKQMALEKQYEGQKD